MDTRTVGRIVALSVVVVCLATVGQSYAAASSSDGGVAGAVSTHSSVAPRDGITVISTDSNTWLGKKSDGPRADAEIVAYAPNGSILYYNDTHTRYWDVDPVKGTETTVEVVYADHLSKEECHAETVCTRNGVERINLTTGEVTDIYHRITPGKHSTRWHDIDRIDNDSLAVADIARDRVYVVNTTSGLVEWEWDALQDYSPKSGGPYPEDWTHINDVEVVRGDQLMVSMRNQDQVVFLDPETGLVKNWTLGSEDNYSVLYEQHNPDYINESNGGPAIVAADSENNRLVEYRRVGTGNAGRWEQSWTWSDDRLQWPRDADRLPNNHTLVTDSNGNRVFEIDENGDIVWSVNVAFPYEAERLDTGDESTGGHPIGSVNDSGGTGSNNASAAGDSGGSGLKDGPWANAVAYVLPVWMNLTDAFATLVLGLTLLGWVVVEARWAPYAVDVDVERPRVSVRRDDEGDATANDGGERP